MYKNFKKLMILFLCLFVLCCSFTFLYTNNKNHEYEIFAAGDNKTLVLDANESIQQEFICPNDYINGISLSIQTPATGDFDLQYQIKSAENNQVLIEGIQEINKSEGLVSIPFNKELKGLKDKKIIVNLSTNSNGVVKFKASAIKQLNFSVLFTGITKYYKLCFFISILILVFSILLYVALFYTKFTYNKIFFIALLFFGILFNLLIPISNVPDEANAHITKAYHYSNVLMGIQDDVNDVKIRKSDQALFSYAYIDDQKMDKYLSDLFSTNVDNTMISSKQKMLDTKGYSFTYYLSAVGITIGRFFNLNGILCMLIARMLNYLLFVFVACYCVKKIPVFKEIISVFCLLPITIQQTCSLSYDSIVISFALLITTLTISLFYQNHLSKKDTILLCVSCVLISLTKQFAYSPIILAPLSYFLIGKIQDIWKNKKHRKYIYISCFILFVFCILVFIFARHVTETSMFYLIGHPKTFIKVFVYTMHYQLMFYFNSTIGSSLGLLSIGIFEPVILFYFILLTYVLMKIDTSEIEIKIEYKFIFVLIFFICFIGILLSMYSWSFSNGFSNITTNLDIKGFQGRYLLPVLPLFLIACCNKKVDKDSMLMSKILYMGSFLLCMTLFSIMSVIG